MSKQPFSFDTCQRKVGGVGCDRAVTTALQYTFFHGSTKGQTINVCYPCYKDLVKKDIAQLNLLPNYAKSK